ncbi:MAG: hypothetical protein COB50_05425, partial [Thiotrichales bacterium]
SPEMQQQTLEIIEQRYKNQNAHFNNLIQIGLLKSVTTNTKRKQKELTKQRYFVHLTFQEYFAARYLVKHIKDYDAKTESAGKEHVEVMQFICQNKYDSSCKIMLQFAAGLLYQDYKATKNIQHLQLFWQAIESSPRDLVQINHIALTIQLLNECHADTEIKVQKQLLDKSTSYLLEFLQTQHSLTGYSAFNRKIVPILARCNFVNRSSSMQKVVSFIIKVVREGAGGYNKSSDAVETLGNLGNTSDTVLEILVNILIVDKNTSFMGLHGYAAEALGNLGNTSNKVIKSLTAALKHDALSEEAHRSIVDSFSKLGRVSDEVINALIYTFGLYGAQDIGDIIKTHAIDALVHLSKTGGKEIIIALMKTLNSQYSSGSATIALIKIVKNNINFQEELIPSLVEMLKNKKSDIGDNAKVVLSYFWRVGKAIVPSLLKILEDKDSNISLRCRTIYVIGELEQSNEIVISKLIHALKDQNDKVRISAATALGNLCKSNEIAISALMSALKDKNNDVRISAAKALGNLGKSIGRLSIAVRHSLGKIVNGNVDFRLISVALNALVQLDQSNTKLINSILNILQEKSFMIPSMIVKILGNLDNPDDKVVKALTNVLMNHEDSDARRDAANSLRRIGKTNKEIISALIHALEDKDCGVFRNAAYALKKLLDKVSPQIIPVLLKALKNDDFLIRNSIVHILGRLAKANEAIMSALIKSFRRSDHSRTGGPIERALLNFNKANHPELTSALLKALIGKDYYIRCCAADMLGKLSFTNKEVIFNLIKCLSEKYPQMRYNAANSLINLNILNPYEFQEIIVECCVNENIDNLNILIKAHLLLGMPLMMKNIADKQHKKLILQVFINQTKQLKLSQNVYKDCKFYSVTTTSLMPVEKQTIEKQGVIKEISST